MTPFLKWAGGKRWFIDRYSSLLPNNYSNYYEPFLGSGAVYFSLCPEKAFLGDSNKDLILTYRALKTNWQRVWKILMQHHDLHCPEHYYAIRNADLEDKFERAARFIYLNRTCWNGLYRVNLKGEFNVPIGTKSKVLLTSDDFTKVSKQLKKASLVNADFEELIDQARKNDLVFVDPPYTVKHALNGFIKYNENLFSWNDQIRLRDCLLRAKRRGARIVLTNAYHKSILGLYRDDFSLRVVKRPSVIAGDNEARKLCREYVIIG